MLIKKRISFINKSLLRRSFSFKNRLRNLQNTYAKPYDFLLDKQSERFSQIVNHAYRHSAFYKDLYDRYGVEISQIQHTGDVEKLPVVTKEMVKKNVNKILTTPKLFCRKAFTSGTSGIPLTLYRDTSSILEEEAYICKHRTESGFQLDEKSISLRGDLNRKTFKIFDPISKTLHLSIFQLKESTVDKYYTEIKKLKPKAIFAYPSAIETLANFMLERGLYLNIPYVFTSSETLYDFQRPKIENAFNTRLVDWYGNAERSIALEEDISRKGCYRELPTYSLNEYYEDHALTTGFINFSFPLIRYRVDDIIVPSDQPGRVEKIVGKSDDSIVLPDGTRIVRLGGPFKALKEIKYAQIIQSDYTSLDINIVPSKLFDEGVFSVIRKRLRKRLGNTVSLNFNFIDEEQIIKTNRGKFKFVVNNLSK